MEWWGNVAREGRGKGEGGLGFYGVVVFGGVEVYGMVIWQDLRF